jgi:FkbM family methyltransferase
MERKAAIFDELFLDQEYYWLASRLRPNTVLLDLGAHIGDTAIYFAQFKEVAKVIALEPTPLYYNLAKKYTAAVPFASKIRMLNKAVSADGQARRAPAGWYGDSFSQNKGETEGKMIPSDTMKSLLSGLRNVAIKCDIEGDEKQIFEDADLSNVYAIEVETHSGFRRAVEKQLMSKGFKVTLIKSKTEYQGVDILGAYKSGWKG